jgi:uncharacterized membrane protein
MKKMLWEDRKPQQTWLLALGGLMLLTFAVVTWLSVSRYLAYNTIAFDLARMSEAIWQTLQGDLLYFTSEGIPFSRLSFHVELFYLLLAPLYALWPSPSLLLVVQALLYTSGAIPAFRLAERRLDSAGFGFVLALIYLFYPVAQTAVLFEFHADTLAMPMLLFALEALDRDSHRQYAFWVALALSCKYYVAVPVFFLGALTWLRGKRQVGGWTMAVAALWGFLTFFVIRGLFAPEVGADEVKATTSSYLAFFFGQISEVRETLMLRVLNGLIVILPAALLSLRALGWLFVASTIILPVLISSGPGPVYFYIYHHYALAVPFLVMAIIDGAVALRNSFDEMDAADRQRALRKPLLFTVGMTLLLNMVTVDTPLSPLFYRNAEGSGGGMSTTGYRVQPRDRMKDSWLEASVPAGAVVAADRTLGQRLINRDVLYLTQPAFAPFSDLLPNTDYVAVDALYDYVLGVGDIAVDEGVAKEHGTIAMLLADPAWGVEKARDGLLLFSRNEELEQRLEVGMAADEADPLATYGNAIGLMAFEARQTGPRRFLLTYEWKALESMDKRPPLIAVSRLEGLPFSRIVHLPTLGLHPSDEWEAGSTVRESFEIEMPAEAEVGDYALHVGWYDTGSVYAPLTDERSRLGSETMVGMLTWRSRE